MTDNKLLLRQKIGFFIALCSYGLLIPGVSQALMTLSAKVNMFGIQAELFKETRSIWQTVETLWHSNYGEVAVMIVTFSIIIPAMKAILMLVAVWQDKGWLWQLISIVSKWSMADVFVVAILVAFFTAKATAELSAELHHGFYYFTGYCLLSIISGQLIQPKAKD